MSLGTATVIRADARNLPLADNSVDLVVTSPPYFALRSYQDGGEHYDGQIGDEPTPAAFVDSLIEVTRECVRVLKPSGSLWVNLGDKYAGKAPGKDFNANAANSKSYADGRAAGYGRTADLTGFRDKSLMGIPWRYALRCIDDLGLILRSEVIWSKPNGLPESVTDRVRRSHETWFHFTLQPRYFSAVDEIREPHMFPNQSRTKGDSMNGGKASGLPSDVPQNNPLGKLPGSVWTVPTEPLRVPDHLGIDHFAAFPTEWPKRIIQGWSPSGVCVECGEGRRPVMETTRPEQSEMQRNLARILEERGQRRQGQSSTSGIPASDIDRRITGYACACAETLQDPLGDHIECWEPEDCNHQMGLPPTTPAVVLDPFGGTGTTAMVAKALGRHGISVDMSADYCRLAEWRTNDRDQLAKVLGVAKAEQQPADQMSMLDLLAEEPA